MTSDDSKSPNPYTRPGFLAAAALVIILAVVGVVLGIGSLTRDDSKEAAPSGPSTSGTSEPSPVPSESVATSTSDSICGLEGETLAGTVTVAPVAEWQFQGTTGYPASDDYGPGDSTSDGIRMCFQHSPEGALLMAANGLVQGSDPATGAIWGEYALAEGANREALLADLTFEGDGSDTRTSIVGFRVLDYQGESARIDIAARVSVPATTVMMSAVFELIWIDGDWKLDTNEESPLSIASIPDTAGYTPWGS